MRVLFALLLAVAPMDPATFQQELDRAIEHAEWHARQPKKRVSRAKPQPRAAEQITGGNGDVWEALARCESGMRNDGGAPYYGYFQFAPATWRGVGMSGLPSDHDYGTQLAAAKRLQARSGWGQWPACSRKLGLR